MSDPSPYNKQPNKDINFNGQLTINVLGRPVTVNYLDESHNKIAESKIITGYFGDNYKTEQVDVPGYTFISVDGEKVRKIGAKNVIVNYYYKKESTPTVPTTPTTPTVPTTPTTPPQQRRQPQRRQQCRQHVQTKFRILTFQIM